MIPAKEKAKELVNKFINYSQQCINDEIINQFNLENPAYKGSKFSALMRFSEKYNAKQCALIAVDELIKQVSHSDVCYWKEVKNEINLL